MPRLLTVLAATALLVAGTAASHAQDVVRIGWLRGTNDLTLAKARGTLEEALKAKGARVEWAGPFPASAPAVEALNAGSIDITVGSSTSSVASLAAKAPIAIFAYQPMGVDAEAIVVPGTSPLASVKDLAGKSVAVNRGGTGEYLLVRALEKNGVPLDSVKRVYLGPADAGPAFAQGHVDAWAIWDPFLSIALTTYGGKVLANGPAIGSQNAIVLIAHRDFAKAKPALLKTVYDTIVSENQWSLAHKEEAGRIWAKELGVPEALAPALGNNNAVPTGATTADATRTIEAISKWYVANGIVPSVQDVGASTLDLSK